MVAWVTPIGNFSTLGAQIKFKARLDYMKTKEERRGERRKRGEEGKKGREKKQAEERKKRMKRQRERSEKKDSLPGLSVGDGCPSKYANKQRGEVHCLSL